MPMQCPMQFHDSASRGRVAFEPIDPGNVRLYVNQGAAK